MTKQQKQLELEKRINATKILESLEELKLRLRKYAGKPELTHSNYAVGMKAEDVIKTAEELEQRIESLIKYVAIEKNREREALE